MKNYPLKEHFKKFVTDYSFFFVCIHKTSFSIKYVHSMVRKSGRFPGSLNDYDQTVGLMFLFR